MAEAKDVPVVSTYQVVEARCPFSMYPIASLEQNERKEVLKEISTIKFSRLKRLSVAKNGIESIETINRILLPAIEFLQFGRGFFIKAPTTSTAYLH